jgi:hypothetical protein
VAVDTAVLRADRKPSAVSASAIAGSVDPSRQSCSVRASIARGTLGAPALIRTETYGLYLIEDDPQLIEHLHREVQRLHPQAESQT